MRKDSIKKVMAGAALLSVCTCYSMPVFAYTNEEAVYSKLDNNGKSYKTIVSTVENDGDKNKVSQQEVNNELPIECKVTYKLDGKEMTAEEIAGKSGRVTITLKYTNKAENEVVINGKTEKMYTPFLVVSGVILDNEKNTNIEVNHGKVLNNGEMTVAAGFAVPGLVESLKIDKDIDVCDTIEISMDAKDFELKNIMTYASPKVFGSMDIKMSDFDELFGKVNDLKNASSQIESGAEQLNNGIILLDNGIGELKSGSKTLENGVNTLDNGAKELNQGAKTLNNGIAQYNEKNEEFNQAVGQVAEGSKQLNAQYSELDNGINELNKKSNMLNAGAKDLNDGVSSAKAGVDEMNSKVGEASEGITKLGEGASAIETGSKDIETALETGKGAVSGANTQVENASENVTDMIAELKEKNEELETLKESQDDAAIIEVLDNQISYNNSLITKLTTVSGQLNGAKKYISGTSDVIDGAQKGVTQINGSAKQIGAGISSLGTGLSNLSNGITQLSDGMNTLENGAAKLYGGTTQLIDGTGKLADGSSKVSNGIGALSNGTSGLYSASNQLNAASNTIQKGAYSLSNGTASLSAGVSKLSEGATTLSDGVDRLAEGSKELVDGSQKLTDGIKQFNSEGINKICNFVDNDCKNIIRRVEKLSELSKNYDQFASEKKREDIHFFNIMDVISTADTSKKNNK